MHTHNYTLTNTRTCNRTHALTYTHTGSILSGELARVVGERTCCCCQPWRVCRWVYSSSSCVSVCACVLRASVCTRHCVCVCSCAHVCMCHCVCSCVSVSLCVSLNVYVSAFVSVACQNWRRCWSVCLTVCV